MSLQALDYVSLNQKLFMKINQWLEKINAERVASIQDIKIKHKQIS